MSESKSSVVIAVILSAVFTSVVWWTSLDIAMAAKTQALQVRLQGAEDALRTTQAHFDNYLKSTEELRLKAAQLDVLKSRDQADME